MYSITELPTPEWEASHIVCGSSGGSSFTYTGAVDGSSLYETGDNTVNILLAPGDLDVECTFVNDQKATITIVNDVVDFNLDDASDAQDFAFTASGTPSTLAPSSFVLDDDAGAVGQDTVNADTQVFEDVEAGTYTITETTPPPDGWVLSNIVCSSTGGSSFVVGNDTDNGGTDGFDAGDDRVVITVVEIDDTPTCTFEHQDVRGSIVIVKDTVDNNAQDFAFEASWFDVADAPDFTLDDDAGAVGQNTEFTNTVTFDNIIPGTGYTVTETPVDGWDTTIVCDDGSSTIPSTGTDGVATINVDPGETVTCTYTNTDVRGSIVIVKDAVDNNAQDFAFEASWFDVADAPDFSLDDDAGAVGQDTLLSNTTTFDNLIAGTYTVTETAVPGWETTIECTNNGTGGDTITTPGVATIDLEPGTTVTCTYTNTDVRGSIVIVKDAVDNNAQDFDFEASWFDVADAPDFTLDDDAGAVGQNTVLTNTTTFDNLIAGTYTVTETAVPGWETTIECTNNGTGGDTITTPGVATIDLEPGTTVTCTYTNTDVRGSIVIVKDAVNNNAQDFAFTTTGTGLSDFSLDDDAGAVGQDTLLSDTTTFNNLIAGTYTVTETAVPGWDTSLVCTGNGNGGTATGGVATIVLDPSATVTCTYTNTEQGTITIVKDALPDVDVDFDYSHDIVSDPAVSESFVLNDGTAGVDTQEFLAVSASAPQTSYTVSEAPEDGWDLTDIVCTSATGESLFNITNATGDAPAGFDAGDDRVLITLAPGDDANCTFVNTQRGTIDITKTAAGGDETFDFTENTTGDPVPFSIATQGGTGTLQQPFTAPGDQTYTIIEASKAGWDLTNIECTPVGTTGYFVTNAAGDGPAGFDAGDDRVVIDLGAGDAAGCTFTNTKRGQIIVKKATLPNPDTDGTVFDFTGEVEPSLENGESSTALEVVPGSYEVTETATQGWDLTGITCDDSASDTPSMFDGATATFNVDPGETVTCTFTNTKRGTIHIVKDAVPNDAQDFAFGGDLDGFTLDDDLGAAGEDATYNNEEVLRRPRARHLHGLRVGGGGLGSLRSHL